MAVGRSVLYFPTIEFRDEGWLRAALCIWDDVYRIVPPGYMPYDSVDVRRLQDAGLVKRIELAQADMDQAASEFVRFVEDNPCRPAALTGNADEIRRLHRGKVGERLHRFFEVLGDPLRTNDSWYGVPAPLCHAYMLYLAETVARRRGMAKATDSKDSFAVAPFVDRDGCLDDMGYSPDAAECEVVLGLMAAVPQQVEDIPIDKLLAFRERTTEGRAAFAAAIEEHAKEFGKIVDRKHAMEMASRFAAALDRSHVMIQKQSARSIGDLGRVACCVGVPAALTALGAFGLGSNDPFTPAKISGSILIGMAATIAQAGLQQNAPVVDPVRSYYVSLCDSIEPVFRSRYASRANDFWAVMEEFIND